LCICLIVWLRLPCFPVVILASDCRCPVNHCDYCHWQIHNNLLHVRSPQQKPCSYGNMSKYLLDLWQLQRDRWVSLENRNLLYIWNINLTVCFSPMPNCVDMASGSSLCIIRFPNVHSCFLAYTLRIIFSVFSPKWLVQFSDFSRILTIINFVIKLQVTDHYARYEVLTAVKLKMLIFWVVTPCVRVGRYRRFGEIYGLELTQKVQT
jgi:hypothetical protein